MGTVFYERALLWIVLLPLAAALVNGVFGRFASKKLVGTLAVGSVGLSFALSIFVFMRLTGLDGDSPQITNHLYEWFSLGFGVQTIPVNITFVADPLSGIMLLVVTGIGFLIHLYSLEYMSDEPGFARFFSYLNLFTASMLVLVLASSLPVMFIGWEGVGLCSYLLIGFWYKNAEYAAAGRKAFVVNRIGDFGVLIGMFILMGATSTFEFAEINDRADSLTQPFVFMRESWGMTATVACLFLFLGCAGKSAQIPLYVWLPDAMAGPTPVSALIHAATMVTAGVYLVCRLSDVFILSPTAMAVIAITGALTALLAASIALVQNHMKRILAYSTVSQLGFMFAAVGVGAFSAGIFHVFTHAFFKACLFLGAGAVMHAVHAHGDADIRKLGGLAKKLPVVHGTFLVSCLAIAGVPLFSGFFSKDEILLGAISAGEYFGDPAVQLQAMLASEAPNNYPWPIFVAHLQAFMLSITPWLVFGILSISAAMTAFYMFRLYFLTFSGSEYRSAPAAVAHHDADGIHNADGAEHAASDDAATDDAHAASGAGHHDAHGYHPHPHNPGWRIAVPLAVLALGAFAAGYLGLPHVLGFHPIWGEWLYGTVAAEVVADAGMLGWIAMGVGIAAAVAGIALAFVRYNGGNGVPSMAEPRGLHRVLMNKWYVDEFYDKTVLRLSRFLGVVAANLDKYAVDGLLARASSVAVQGVGWTFTRLQNGLVYAYAAVMVLGVAVLGWWFTTPHPQLTVLAEGSDVEWTAAAGVGYVYRWDTNSDGVFEDCAERTCSAVYDADDIRGFALVIRGIRPSDLEEIRLDDDDSWAIDAMYLVEGWEPDGEQEQRWPVFRVEDGKVILDPGGANVRVHGQTPTEPQELAPGDTVQLGQAIVRIGAVVEGTVEVTSVFGSIARDTEEVVVEAPFGEGDDHDHDHDHHAELVPPRGAL
jgi:NADH-quinone oxidoreductase subunit L